MSQRVFGRYKLPTENENVIARALAEIRKKHPHRSFEVKNGNIVFAYDSVHRAQADQIKRDIGQALENAKKAELVSVKQKLLQMAKNTGGKVEIQRVNGKFRIKIRK